MKLKLLIAATCTSILASSACSNQPNSGTTVSTPSPAAVVSQEPASLPNEGFKAELTIVDPPAKLRAGERVTIKVKVKNGSSVQWWSRGGPKNSRNDNKFYIAAGNRWLKADGSLLTNMDGRHGLAKDLKPGEEEEVPLQVTAPTNPGDYTLEVDLVQEGVAWFSEKGSPTAKVKITVAK